MAMELIQKNDEIPPLPVLFFYHSYNYPEVGLSQSRADSVQSGIPTQADRSLVHSHTTQMKMDESSSPKIVSTKGINRGSKHRKRAAHR